MGSILNGVSLHLCEARFQTIFAKGKGNGRGRGEMEMKGTVDRMGSLLRGGASFRSHAAPASASSTIAQVLNVRGLGRK